jgi:putative phosphoesterase
VRIAILSDIHGNVIALDAVLADARAAGAEHFWILGDLVAIGPEPVAVLERVSALPKTTITRGNTDRYTFAGDRPPPSLEVVRGDPDLIERYAQIGMSFAWTRGYITHAGWFDWLEALPLDARLTLPDGRRLLGVHASPGTDDGEGVHPGRSTAELAELMQGCAADIVLVGHTHEPMLRAVGDVQLVNIGSVSNPMAPDLRASYILLDASPGGTRIEYRRVDYDRAAFAAAVRRSRHPASRFILGFQEGKRLPRPPHADHQPHPLNSSVELPRPRRLAEL